MFAHKYLPSSGQESLRARDSTQTLARYVRKDEPLMLRVVEDDHEAPIELPAGAVTLLMDILEAMAAGRGITLIPAHAELTTVQAADILNVSRPFLIKLLDAGKIPHHKVGRHRRIRLEDLMSYKETIDREREAVLDQLTAETQEMGLYD